MNTRGRRRKTASPHPTLTFEQLYEGHDKTVRNAERLFGAGTTILKQYPDIALGLYELGQEEIGKSFSFLAAFGYGPSDPQWQDFWQTWRDHRTKAYRAFFYEWFSPTRLTVSEELDGFPRKSSIEREKEASFYIDYLRDTGRFVSPGEQTDALETANRSAILISHVVTASYIKTALDEGDKQWNYQTFSALPALILTTGPRQEAMPAILDRFAARSDRHRLLVDNLRSSLQHGAAWLRDLPASNAASPPEDLPVDSVQQSNAPEKQ